MFSRSTTITFVLAALPFSVWILAYEHLSAVEQDNALMRMVARNISPQGNTLVFEFADASQHARLQQRISIRTAEKTYSFSETTIKPTRPHPARISPRQVPREQDSLSRKQAKRMRLILHFHDAPVPDDIVLFSHRGPLY